MTWESILQEVRFWGVFLVSLYVWFWLADPRRPWWRDRGGRGR